MPIYRLQEADLEIPDTWHDQSINIFKLPAVDKAKEASFVISRDSGQDELQFLDCVAAQLKSAEQQLPGFKLIKHWDFTLHQHAASLLDYTWERDGRELMLRQMFIEHKPAVLIATLTTTPDDLIHHEAIWKQVMQSFKPVTYAAP
jgi:hypothetical protein